MRWGDEPDRVVLLHDAGRDLDAWGPLPARLAARLPVAVVNLDLPGHGLSDDPWREDDAADLLRVVLRDTESAGRTFVVTAGQLAGLTLGMADELGIAGLIALSPQAPSSSATLLRSPTVPKLLFAGALAGDDLQVTRQVASFTGGWAVVTSIPAATTGTDLLDDSWRRTVFDQIETFLRDCLIRRPR